MRIVVAVALGVIAATVSAPIVDSGAVLVGGLVAFCSWALIKARRA